MSEMDILPMDGGVSKNNVAKKEEPSGLVEGRDLLRL